MSDRSRLRLVVLQVLVLSLMATLLGRLWYLQVVTGDTYTAAATANSEREVITSPVRGLILDSSGQALVRNRTSLVVSVDRTEIANAEDEGVLDRLAGLIGGTGEQLAQRLLLCGEDGAPKPPVCWNGSPYQPIPVARDVDETAALEILERREDFPGVTAQVEAVREYPAPEGANAAHLLGYLGPVTDEEVAEAAGSDSVLRRSDSIGRAGLERQYDTHLRGEPGVKRLAVDKAGVVSGTIGEDPAVPGNYVVTNLDARLQAVTEKALLEAIERARGLEDKSGRLYKADSGAAVVLDVKTGAVLAMASYPSYDPTVWVGGIGQDDYDALTSEESGTPLISRAVTGEFAPASTFKVISTSAAVKGGYSLNGTYPCTGSYEVGNRTFKNYESRAYGDITLKRTIEVSCDTVYYDFAYNMWVRDGGNRPVDAPKDYMVNEALGWGLGEPTGIDLPSEKGGRIVTRESRESNWEQNKDTYCRRAETGYPEVTDASRARLLKAIAEENCVDGFRYRAGDAVNFSIGQGETLVTPLQMASVYASLANGGTIYTPQVARAVMSPDGDVVEEFTPQVAGQIPVSDQVRRYLIDALAGVTTDGTGRAPFAGFPLGEIPVATKTGTGEVAGKQTTSWFASFAPADDPQYAVVMMVSQGGTGSGTSGRSVRAIYEALFGVTGSTVNPANAIFPTGAPPAALPTIRTDGTVLGAEGDASAPTTPAGTAATPTATAAPRRRPMRRLTS